MNNKNLLVGDCFTGKTWLLHFLQNKDDDFIYRPTQSLDFIVTYLVEKKILKCKQKKYKLRVCDTTGAERFKNVIVNMVNTRCFDTVFLIYNPAKYKTLSYIKDFYQNCDEKKNVKWFVISMETEYPLTTLTNVEKWCDENNIKHILFDQLTKEIYDENGLIQKNTFLSYFNLERTS